MSRKKCTGCGEVKDYAEFPRNKSKKDGLQSQCKSCCRQYREANREAELERHRRYREEHREAVREYARRYSEENREAKREYARRYSEENREAELERKRRYREEHREVRNEIDRRRRKKINDAMREIATRSGEPWTPAEDAYIMSADEPAALKAMELGRTIESVYWRAFALRKKTAA